MTGRAAALALALFPAFAAAGADPATPTPAPRFGFGRPATADEIRAWDIDVRPDGAGLPPGRGTVAQGTAVYAARCAACHGPAGRNGPFDALVGREPRTGFPFGRDPSLVRTVGNYWPYATTLYDYIRRAMPWMQPGSLEPDEVYGLVAYLLFLNEIVREDAVTDAATLPKVVMPAHDRFVRDNRRGGREIR
jgi:mono/diheme cytochrome c family protein